MKKNRNKLTAVILPLLLIMMLSLLAGCSADKQEKLPVKVLIVPKFEIGEMTGDFPGEAQLFYERYCPGCEETEIPNLPETAHFYYNEENGAAILVTGYGKTAAGLSMMALLSSDMYDFSDTYIVSVGCGGGSADETIFGDVVLVTAACDFDLGHHVDSSDIDNPSGNVQWFPQEEDKAYGCEMLNADLCETAYQKIKDCPLQTTDISKKVMNQNFSEEKTDRDTPAVIKGTALTGDNYWKGSIGHKTAEYIAEYYGCPDPYAVTEMEEIAVANAAKSAGMLDRVISLRVIVNMDLFLKNQSPEKLWGNHEGFTADATDDEGETLDIFEPAMHNLFDAASIIIDDKLS